MAERERRVAQWLPAARAGSAQALGELLETFRGYLLWIAARQLDPELHAKGGASDLVQDTFLKAQQHFGQFRGEGEADLKAWLRQLLLNNVADFTRMYRQTAKRRVGLEAALEGTSGEGVAGRLAAETPSPSGEAIEQEQVRAVQQALARLPEDYRRVIVYRYQEERSFEEIGQLMNLSPNAARKLWLRAVKRLQQESAGPS